MTKCSKRYHLVYISLRPNQITFNSCNDSAMAWWHEVFSWTSWTTEPTSCSNCFLCVDRCDEFITTSSKPSTYNARNKQISIQYNWWKKYNYISPYLCEQGSIKPRVKCSRETKHDRTRNFVRVSHSTKSNSPGIMWLDRDKIATKGFSSELSSTRSQKPQKIQS